MDNNKLPSGWVESKLEDIVYILDNERIPISSAERNKRLENCSNEDLVPYYGQQVIRVTLMTIFLMKN